MTGPQATSSCCAKVVLAKLVSMLDIHQPGGAHFTALLKGSPLPPPFDEAEVIVPQEDELDDQPEVHEVEEGAVAHAAELQAAASVLEGPVIVPPGGFEVVVQQDFFSPCLAVRYDNAVHASGIQRAYIRVLGGTLDAGSAAKRI